jgi:hypothetical protein
MMDRTMGGPAAAPRRTPAWRWLIAALCAAVLAGCGGSGSSGFDGVAAENTAIDHALDTNGCVTERGLTICASGELTPTVPTPEPSPTATVNSNATATPTGTPAFASPTPSPSPTATRPASQPGVDVQPDTADVANCLAAPDNQTCTLRVVFVPIAAPVDAAYRAAVRQRQPDSSWRILPVTGNEVEIVIGPDVAVVQTAILLYEREPGPVPTAVEVLSDSGADFAFVTAPVVVRSSGSP